MNLFYLKMESNPRGEIKRRVKIMKLLRYLALPLTLVWLVVLTFTVFPIVKAFDMLVLGH